MDSANFLPHGHRMGDCRGDPVLRGPAGYLFRPLCFRLHLLLPCYDVVHVDPPGLPILQGKPHVHGLERAMLHHRTRHPRRRNILEYQGYCKCTVSLPPRHQIQSRHAD